MCYEEIGRSVRHLEATLYSSEMNMTAVTPPPPKKNKQKKKNLELNQQKSGMLDSCILSSITLLK